MIYVISATDFQLQLHVQLAFCTVILNISYLNGSDKHI